MIKSLVSVGRGYTPPCNAESPRNEGGKDRGRAGAVQESSEWLPYLQVLCKPLYAIPALQEMAQRARTLVSPHLQNERPWSCSSGEPLYSSPGFVTSWGYQQMTAHLGSSHPACGDDWSSCHQEDNEGEGRLAYIVGHFLLLGLSPSQSLKALSASLSM